MKKLFTIFCIILLVFPMCALAAKSPTTTNKIYSIPPIKYEVIEEIQLILDIDKMLPYDELDGYVWREALIIELDKEYEETKWYLPIDMSESEDAKVAIVGESVYIQQSDIVDNMITVDFTGLEPTIYYLCFFTKEPLCEEPILE